MPPTQPAPPPSPCVGGRSPRARRPRASARASPPTGPTPPNGGSPPGRGRPAGTRRHQAPTPQSPTVPPRSRPRGRWTASSPVGQRVRCCRVRGSAPWRCVAAHSTGERRLEPERRIELLTCSLRVSRGPTTATTTDEHGRSAQVPGRPWTPPDELGRAMNARWTHLSALRGWSPGENGEPVHEPGWLRHSFSPRIRLTVQKV